MTEVSRQRPRFSERWLVEVLDSLSEGVIALDADGRILAANPAAEDLLGFRISERRYEPWDELAWDRLLDEDHEEIPDDIHPVRATLRDRTARDAAVVGLPSPGGTRWLTLATHTLAHPDEDPNGGVVVSFQDRTSRVRAEHGRQRLIELMREFMSSVAHDLRSPLTTIGGWAKMLEDGWDTATSEERRTALASITRQSQHLKRLVDDLSVVGRLEAGGITVDREVAPVIELVDLAMDGAGRPPFDVHVPEGLSVRVDRDHGRRMLLNLIENATKYGRPPFGLVATPVRDGVEIAVTDDGPGVPEDFVPRLFDRFTRSSTGSSTGGTGLGLAIVAGLAELNGGSVRYGTQGDRGARFVLTLERPD